jgi:hypothetical protein
MPTDPHASGTPQRRRDPAVVVPIAAFAAVVVVVGMSMAWPVDGQVVTAAVVGILVLAATLAGVAAGRR